MKQVALITGASSGIGRESALKFAAEGFDLILFGRSQERLDQVSQIVGAAGARVENFAFDIKDDQQLELIFAKLPRISVAINNAAIEGSIGDIDNLNLADFDEVMSTNLRALWLCMREELTSSPP